jgi:hypothetical protein
MTTKPTYINAILSLRPNAKCGAIGNNYDSIIWEDTTMSKPTKDEIDGELIRITHETTLDAVRSKRNELLKNTDKYSLPDFPHSSPEKKQEWLDYRQSLRDITNNLDTTTITFTIDIDIQFQGLTWPTIPS